MKKWVEKLLFGLGVFFAVLLLANFGLNIWLKTQLPKYIKDNTDYRVSYKTLDVDLGTGNIFSTGISVNSKTPQNSNILGVQGTIDTLKINRFGIYDALFNKRISSSDILLAGPNLNIILAKPTDKKKGKKENPFLFENIKISKGKINVFRHTKQKLLSIQQLNLSVENLQMADESEENKLPIVFDKYDIKGKGFFFRVNNVYALTINEIKTSNQQVRVENFNLIPLLSFEQFKRFYPQKAKLFQCNIPEMEFKDIALKKNPVSLSKASFQNPVLTIYNTNVVAEKKSTKLLNYEINLDNINLNNATIQVLKPDGSNSLFAKNFKLNIDELKYNKKTSEEVIPFGYKDFQFSGNNILYSNHQNFAIGNIVFNPKRGELRNVSVTPNQSNLGRRSIGLKVNHAVFNINTLDFANKKLNLDIKDVLVDHANGIIKIGDSEKKVKKTPRESRIEFVLVRKVTLKNSNITYDKGGEPLVFNDLNATLNDIKIAPKPNNLGNTINVKDYFLTTKNFVYKTQFYNLSVGLLKLNKNKAQINNFAMKPLVSRAQFIKMIPVEKDLYDIKANQIMAEGNWDLFSQNKFIRASNVTIQSADANIFRSKIPKDDPKEKPLYSRMLRSIKIPMQINNLDLKNSVLVYEEDTPESAGPGKLTFSNFNMNVKNLNSAKMKGEPTRVDIKIDCSFMKLAPLSVNWNFDVANQNDVFNISGKAVNLPAEGINPFIRPYLHVTAKGMIQEMLFNFKGNPTSLGGTFNLKHKDLKVAILDKNNQEKKGVLTAIANLVVRSDSGNLPEAVDVEDVKRDPTKSFFNLFWKGIEQGLKKTLIGINVDKAKKTVDNTVSAVKDVKQSVKDLKKEIKGDKVSKEEKPKKGFMKGWFKKKEKPETE
ncbi:AsmA family protein [Chryseobacterium oryctis]|uniref:AsmA-like C-terminal region n=1 Tax=Chryseobacterium oryctis TaxID=2952618 RepID=A0ABT3HLX1_9FLAO|nr:hypothetical protein [Chryseobacterium oryctis]MCW3160788.1 hypothetical protein [Chryseobacterium oryctis]